MSLLSRFRGGVHPPEQKLSSGQATRPLDRPARLILPLRQHIGAPCTPAVKVGDVVARGQFLAGAEAPVSAPIHAPLSGKVTALEPRMSPGGKAEPCIVLETAPEDTWYEGLPEALGWNLDPQSLSPDEIRQRARGAGLVGLGGAGFPAAVKLSPREGAAVDVVLLNGAECEPVLTSDHRLMLEQPEKVVLGLRLAMQAVGASRGIIAVENNKRDAAAVLQKAVNGVPDIVVEILPVRYPQGAEKMLVWACLKRIVPLGGLPLDVGVVVQNVTTAAALATAVAEGRPLTERIVTVSGRVACPANLLTPLGTPFSELVAAAGGETGAIAKVIAGGPMMGFAQPSLAVPVTKTTGGIILLAAADLAAEPAGPCIRCGRCVGACPMGLLPAQLAQCAELSRWDEATRYAPSACMECGSCSYVCPARRPLVQSIRLLKAEIGRRTRLAQAKAAAATKG